MVISLLLLFSLSHVTCAHGMEEDKVAEINEVEENNYSEELGAVNSYDMHNTTVNFNTDCYAQQSNNSIYNKLQEAGIAIGKTFYKHPIAYTSILGASAVASTVGAYYSLKNHNVYAAFASGIGMLFTIGSISPGVFARKSDITSIEKNLTNSLKTMHNENKQLHTKIRELDNLSTLIKTLNTNIKTLNTNIKTHNNSRKTICSNLTNNVKNIIDNIDIKTIQNDSDNCPLFFETIKKEIYNSHSCCNPIFQYNEASQTFIKLIHDTLNSICKIKQFFDSANDKAQSIVSLYNTSNPTHIIEKLSYTYTELIPLGIRLAKALINKREKNNNCYRLISLTEVHNFYEQDKKLAEMYHAKLTNISNQFYNFYNEHINSTFKKDNISYIKTSEINTLIETAIKNTFTSKYSSSRDS